MGNTQCECIATHHNQKLLQIFHPTIQDPPNSKTKHPRGREGAEGRQNDCYKDTQNHYDHNKHIFNVFPCSDIYKQPTQPYREQTSSKVSVYQLDEPSIELPQKDYNQQNSNQKQIQNKDQNGHKQNIPAFKENYLHKGNPKKQSSLHLNPVNRRASNKRNQSSQVNKDNNHEVTNQINSNSNKLTLRQRVNKDTQHVKQSNLTSIPQTHLPPAHIPPLQLQTDYSFIQSSMDGEKQITFKILSFQKGVTLREQYDFKKMLEKNLNNLKIKLKLWPEITANQQPFFTQQQKFYYHPDLFEPKCTQRQNIYKIIMQRQIPSETNRFSQQSNEKITKFYRGSVKSITNPRDQSGQSVFFLQGIGEQYCITNGNYDQFTYYNGCYKDNQFEGNGLFIHADLDYYVGEWVNSKAHGHGTFQHYQGMRYQGSWKNDEQHGQGEQYWQDGAIFRGKFFHGYKIYGQFQWPNGTSYLGQFNQNRLQGKGRFNYQDQRYYYGEWKENMMHGYGQFKWRNGQHFRGNYEFDKKHGNGTLILGDGTMIEAKWVEGKIHGKGKVTKKNGEMRIVQWDMGTEIRPISSGRK